MILLKKGTAVKYYFLNTITGELESESVVIVEVREESKISVIPMPRCELPSGIPFEIPFSYEPKDRHWSWAKPDKVTNNG